MLCKQEKMNINSIFLQWDDCYVGVHIHCVGYDILRIVRVPGLCMWIGERKRERGRRERERERERERGREGDREK